MRDVIVGIDLGTTNSTIAFVRDGRPHLVDVDGSPLLPSVVGLAPDGRLLVGRAARNQRHLYPERTIGSVKRRMGEDLRVPLGDDRYTPVEVSAIILRRLKAAAEAELGHGVHRAVITVPAYFSDAQRTATREAGEVAGFTVERILHEPTAASLTYVEGTERSGTFLVYDLGGGTFDVSIVRVQGDLTEVLASHGDTRLGGDDFDALLFDLLRRRFEEATGADLREDLRARARLTRAAEEAKIALSSQAFVQVTEEHLAEVDGVPRHLDTEVTRADYEDLIEPLLERTADSVATALREASLLARDLDQVILVGGATRTPRVAALLQERTGRAPHLDVDPDKAVALGAALHAARLAGEATGRILVDVTPFSFGTSYFGTLDGWPSNDCYKVILHRNTPLPCRQAELFYTVDVGQDAVDVTIFQGDAEDALDNLQIGRFLVDGLDPKARENSPIVFDLALDLNGILQVTVTEKHTGLRKHVVIEDAFRRLSPEELVAARLRVRAALGDDEDEPTGPSPIGAPPPDLGPEDRAAWAGAVALTEKADRLRADLDGADRDEVDELTEALRDALDAADLDAIRVHSAELADVLFYLE